MNTRKLLPALLIAQLVAAACMVNGSESDISRSGRSTPNARDFELSFGFDCVAWQANAQLSGRTPGTMGVWRADGAEPRSCMNFR